MKTFKQTRLLPAKLLLLIVLTLTIYISKGQDTPYHKPVVFKVTVRENPGSTVPGGYHEGYLRSISDTSVSISSDPVIFRGYSTPNVGSGTINFNKIFYLTIWRKGGVGRGVLIGALGGSAIGAIGGFASGDEHASDNNWCIPCFSAGEKAVGLGVVSGLVGGLLGGMVGAVAGRSTFEITGNKEKFNDFKWKLMH